MKVESTVFDLQMSGKLGNVVAGIARGGIRWLRSRVTPSNPKTSEQSVVRNLISSLAGHWKETLSQANRDAWDAYAAQVQQQGLTITGQNWFVGSNVLRGQVNANQPGDPLSTARIDAGPTTLAQATLSPVSASLSAATQLISLTFTEDEGWDDESGDGALLCYASPGVSPSRRFNNAGYNFAGAVVSGVGGASSPATITAPFTVVEDDRVFLRVRSLQADGRYSPEQLLEIVVGA